MSWRELLQHHLPSALAAARIIKNGQIEFPPLRRTYAHPSLHRKIKDRFSQRGGVFFEAGANNGLAQSNTAYLEKYLGWRGILVEAVPHKYVECLGNRPGSAVYHAALVSTDFERDYVPIHYSDLMSVSGTVTEAERNKHLAMGEALQADPHLSGEVFLAPARTVTEIVAASGFPQIDFFSLDVEGAELDVLNGIDFARVRPKNFLIEVRELERVQALLDAKAYRLEERLSHHDYLFVDAAA